MTPLGGRSIKVGSYEHKSGSQERKEEQPSGLISVHRPGRYLGVLGLLSSLRSDNEQDTPPPPPGDEKAEERSSLWVSYAD